MKDKYVMKFDDKADTTIPCQVCGLTYDAAYQEGRYNALCRPCWRDVQDGYDFVGFKLRSVFGDKEPLAIWSLAGDNVSIDRSKLVAMFSQ